MSSSPVEYSIAPPARDPYRDRRPPYSEDAEQAVLSAMLMDADAVARAVEYVDDTMFYVERHRRIFRAMATLAERGDVIDPLTLSDELGRRAELEASGGKVSGPGGAAEFLEIRPTTLASRIKALGIGQRPGLRRVSERGKH